MRIFPRKPTAAVASGPALLMRFLTHGEAVVTVTFHSGDSIYRARCLGCGWQYFSSFKSSARGEANGHAAECRSMPKPEAGR